MSTTVNRRSPLEKTLASFLAAAFIMSGVFINAGVASAAVTVTPASGGTGIDSVKAVNGAAPAFTTIGNIIINEGANGDIAASQASTTLILDAPSGWQFNAGVGSVAHDGTFSSSADISSISIVVTTSTITITLSTDATDNKDDGITISGIQVQALDAGSAPTTGSILSSGTAVINGVTAGVTNFGSLSQTVPLLSQTIDFPALSGKVYGDAAFAVTATSSSALPVSFTSQTAGVCSVSADPNTATVTILTAGTCTIRASQAGNGTYSAAPDVDQSFLISQAGVTVSGITANNKTYDGNVSATIDTTTTTLNGVLPADTANVSLNVAGATSTFVDKNVGTGKTVTIGGLILTGSASGNYSLSQPTATADITVKDLTVTATGINKEYDATANATVTLSTSTDVVDGDAVAASYAAATFATSSASLGITVDVSGIAITGTDTGNYNLLNTTTTASADITPKAINVTANGETKVYGDIDPTLTYTNDPLFSGDLFTGALNRAPGENFGSYAIGVGTLSAGGNYALNFAPADLVITQKTLTVVGLSADSKEYDATSTASLSGTASLFGVVGTDDVNLTGSPVALFPSKNIGSSLAVTVTGYALSGTAAGNYVLSQPSFTADITPKALSVNDVTAENKEYDGTTAAALLYASSSLSGVIGGDVVNIDTSAILGLFADKNVGTGKTVTVSGIAATGADSGNYTVTQPGASADITVRALLVTATGENKVYDGTVDATVTLSDDRVAGDVLSATTTAAAFSDKHIGLAKSISVTGILVSGTDAGNYSANSTTTASADITERAITVTATSSTKNFDGNTSSPNFPDITSGSITAGDTVNFTQTFDSSAVGTNKTLTPTGTIVDGNGGANYSVTFVTSTDGTILSGNTPGVTVSGFGSGPSAPAGGQVLGASTENNAQGPQGTGSGNNGSTSGQGGQVLGASRFNFAMNLRFGMRNNDVLELQKALKELGFFNVEPTGYFGRITLGAVQAYQRSKGLPATGFFGPLTRAAINSFLASL